MRCCFFLLFWLSLGSAWLSPRSIPHRPPTTALDYSQSNSNDDDRLRQIRQLQTAFYQNTTSTAFDRSTGRLFHLPLWRVSWHELPGRANVLNVHEAMYTNMFESILHADPPWYVGHLGTDNDSKGVSAQVWNNDDHNSAVIGTLLKIVDYRRLNDGRLLLLVHGLERFVVEQVVQDRPYSMAHVRFLPDAEEIDCDAAWIDREEGEVEAARALAVEESFLRWHRYEFENTLLPLPLQADLAADQVIGSALAKVLPLAPYSSIANVTRIASDGLQEFRPRPVPHMEPQLDRQGPTLEAQLLARGWLRHPALDAYFDGLSADDLEVRLWLALNDFLKNTRKAVPVVLLGFLPRSVEWPEGFCLEELATAIAEETQLDHKCVRLHPAYPALRRQKRLSYAAAALLEEAGTIHEFRQELLAIPSTRDRLAYLLLRLQDEWSTFQ